MTIIEGITENDRWEFYVNQAIRVSLRTGEPLLCINEGGSFRIIRTRLNLITMPDKQFESVLINPELLTLHSTDRLGVTIKSHFLPGVVWRYNG